MSRPLPPPSASAQQERRSRWPWLISVAVHLAVFGWWATLPDSEPAEPTLATWTPIELVELPSGPPAEVEPEPVATEPVSPTPPLQPQPGATAPTSSPTAPTGPSSPRPRGSGEPTPGRGEPNPNAGGATEDPIGSPSAGGLALSGLRDDSQQATRSSSLRPKLAPPARLGGSQVVRRTGAAGVDAVPRRDGPPRSLADAGFRPRRSGKLVFRDSAGRFKATLRPDGRVKFKDLPVAIGRDPNTGQVKMGMPGAYEAIQTIQGQELYQQEKRRLLEATFDLRLQMAVDFARDKLDRRLKSLYRELLDGWSSSSTTEAQRRVALFERWDECEEGLSVALPGFDGAATSELDELRHTAGEQARETIERFIRRHLPRGSAEAFTADELARFNGKRRSRGRFDPYRG